MIERIEAFLSHHIALYACEMGELGELYMGYYKVFGERPGHFFEQGHVAEGTVDTLLPSIQEAFDEALEHARQVVRELLWHKLASSETPVLSSGFFTPAADFQDSAFSRY